MTEVSAAEFDAFLKAHFDEDLQARPVIDVMESGYAVITRTTDASHLRPGNMVSGPTQMALADTVAYACVFTRAGITPMAVTSSLDIHFLRPCIGPAMRGEARMIRFGRSRAVMDVKIYGEGHTEPSATAIVVYALPS